MSDRDRFPESADVPGTPDPRLPADLADVPVDDLTLVVVERLDAFRAATLADPPSDLAARIHARVAQEARPAAPWWRPARLSLVFASAALVVVVVASLGVFLVRSPQATPPIGPGVSPVTSPRPTPTPTPSIQPSAPPATQPAPTREPTAEPTTTPDASAGTPVGSDGSAARVTPTAPSDVTGVAGGGDGVPSAEPTPTAPPSAAPSDPASPAPSADPSVAPETSASPYATPMPSDTPEPTAEPEPAREPKRTREPAPTEAARDEPTHEAATPVETPAPSDASVEE